MQSLCLGASAPGISSLMQSGATWVQVRLVYTGYRFGGSAVVKGMVITGVECLRPRWGKSSVVAVLLQRVYLNCVNGNAFKSHA